MSNLRQIGIANGTYLGDNDLRFPYAGIRFTGGAQHLSWDDLLNHQLGFNYTKTQLRAGSSLTNYGVMKILLCPSDRIKIDNTGTAGYSQSFRRTYAMPRHNMGQVAIGNRTAAQAKADWPPSADNLTGIGLTWNHDDVTANAWNNADAKWDTASDPDPVHQLYVAQDMVTESSSTILMTEKPHGTSIAGNMLQAFIPAVTGHTNAYFHDGTTDPTQDRATFSVGTRPKTYHNNKFNYLMTDGHVEFLDPQKTLPAGNSSRTTQAHMWTIRPGD